MDFTHLSQISQGFLAIFSFKYLILVKWPARFTGWVGAWRLRVLSHDDTDDDGDEDSDQPVTL